MARRIPELDAAIRWKTFYDLLTQRQFKEERDKGIVAAVFTFSIIPIAYTEQIEAMGLAESIGTFFLILFTFTLLWARDNKQKFRWIIPGISLGLCIMSSPGSFYASILISMTSTPASRSFVAAVCLRS